MVKKGVTLRQILQRKDAFSQIMKAPQIYFGQHKMSWKSFEQLYKTSQEVAAKKKEEEKAKK